MCELRDHANLRNKTTSREIRDYERMLVGTPKPKYRQNRYFIGWHKQQEKQGIDVSRRIVGRTHIIDDT